jgi:ADP-ribose pyrophosphatase YjhB (NUDIX family)
MTLRRRIHPEDYGFNGDELSSGTIVFDNKGRVLIVNAAGGRHSRHSFPKGHVEYGETLQECAIRETLEETGILVRITNDTPYSVRYRTYGKSMKDVCLFEAEVISGTPRNLDGETKDVGFVPVSKALELLPYTHAKALKECLANKTKKQD